MDMFAVSSSNVSAVGYDDITRTLYVDFLHGGSYQYFNVPEWVFEGLKNASSPGSYLNSEVKGRYAYTTT